MNFFGYEEGAFTGANKGGKIGKFQFADGGSVFLDEIGDMPQHMQVKLLRVLQEKEFEPVGSLYPKKTKCSSDCCNKSPFRKNWWKKSYFVKTYFIELMQSNYLFLL
ncbi:sigma 54-interacting transcriptional regulator [Peribacillus frigoritolerans]|nr:sigma 54-interacting transcriptional regulator [Peribacillus frigoritolerans]